MFTSIWNDFKGGFKTGNMVTRIILINIAVFVVVNLVLVVVASLGYERSVYESFLHFFCISKDLWHNLTHPWVIITSMFLHEGIGHIFWNLIFLYWFGKIIGDFIGDHRVLPIYLVSGIAGGIVYFATANLLAYGVGSGYALGASAGVTGIAVAAATVSPNYIIRLLFVGDVKIKYIVAVFLLLDMVSIANQNNTGGHWAHLGGAFMGFVFISQMHKGNDWSEPINSFLNRIGAFFHNIKNRLTGKPNKLKVRYKKVPSAKKVRNGKAASTPLDLSHQEQLDAILDKIKQSGYESLTSAEKEFLFNASKKK